MTGQTTGRFDIHQHVGALIGIPGSLGTQASVADDCAARLRFMDRFAIGQAALMPGHSYHAPRGIADIMAINDGLCELQQLAPNRFPSLFGTVDPRHGNRGIEEVDRLHRLGFRGLSWHHRMQGLPIDAPIMFDIVERMNALGLIAMLHCYARADFESPWRLRRLAARYPNTRFVALDAMTSPENLEELIATAASLENVMVDLTSTSLGPRGLRLALAKLGAERLVFGSNYYSLTNPNEVAALAAIEAAGLTPRETELILGENTRRLLTPSLAN